MLGAVVGVTSLIGGRGATGRGSGWTALPEPQVDEPATAREGEQVAVFSGGCFWGVQMVFQHVQGVTGVTAGYTGGSGGTANYDEVSTGTTGHAESVRITYDPARVSYGQLLQVFFGVAHDPTELDRQGPDVGTQYRSAIWYATPEQERAARAYIAQLTEAKVFREPIATQVLPLRGFYPAEGYHQDYGLHNPGSPYILINDAPKVARLRERFPGLYNSTPVTYAARASERSGASAGGRFGAGGTRQRAPTATACPAEGAVATARASGFYHRIGLTVRVLPW
jgi:peptide-methionine (S)-S-oxide reductase